MTTITSATTDSSPAQTTPAAGHQVRGIEHVLRSLSARVQFSARMYRRPGFGVDAGRRGLPGTTWRDNKSCSPPRFLVRVRGLRV